MADTSARLPGRRILVVEDESILGVYFRDLLQAADYIVTGPVPTVAGALAALSHDRFDAAILDLNLRGERSLAIAQRMEQQSTPFVIISGYRGDQPRERVLRAAPYLEKPFSAVTLLNAVAKAVARRSARIPA